MWIYFLLISIVNIISLPPKISSAITNDLQSSNPVLQQFANNNVLLNKEPPIVVKELPFFVSFYSDDNLWLRCNIRGTPMPSYQWYATNSDLTDSSQSVHDQIFYPIKSANEETLVIDGNKTKTYFKFVYYCSAKNALGYVESNKIIVQKVTRPSSLSIKYIRHSVYKGEKFVVQCTLVPDIMTLYKFQHWEIKLNSGKILKINKTGGRYSVVVATKFPQLHIRNVTEEDFSKTKFRCIFYSTIDNQDDVLSNSMQSIDEEFSYNFISLSTTLGCMGETVTATVGTNIELPFCSVPRTLNATWYKVDANDPKKKIEIGNQSNDTKFIMISRRYGNLLIVNVTEDDSGTYLVESNDRRLKTSFTLNVYNSPVINVSPKNIHKNLSDSAEFLCRGNVPKIQFRWLHNGQKIASGYDDGNVEIKSTLTESFLRIKHVRLSVSGVYQCIGIFIDEIKGGSEYRQSSGTLLLSEVPPTLVKQFPFAYKDSSTAHVHLSANDTTMSLECVFAANPKPNIEWFHNSDKAPITTAIKVFIDEDQNSIYQSITKVSINFRMTEFSEDIRRYAGEYKAVATNSIGVATCNTFIFVDGNLEIRLPSEQRAVGGNDHLLTCFFVANSVPEFSWDRKIENSEMWESLPVNHRTNLVEKGHRLLLKDVIKSEDQGVYRCRIKLNKNTVDATTKLLVAYPPVLQNLPSKLDSTQSQTHICTIKSIADKPWYAWWSFTKYNSNVTTIISPLTKDAMFSVYYSQEIKYPVRVLPGVPDFVYNYPNVGVDLYVKARSDDKDSFGKFICHARNHIGYDEKTIRDNFLRLEFNKSPPSSSEVVIGDDLYLDCTAKQSDLKPVVKWRLPNEDFKYVDVVTFQNGRNDRIYQFPNGTLVMKSIQTNDPSKLFCFIFPIGNSEKVKSKIAYVEIRVPAWIKPMEKEISKIAGSTFNLSCDVYGHNQNLLVAWYFRSSDMGLWSKFYEACIHSNENPCVSQYEVNHKSSVPIIQIHNRTHHTVHLEFRNVTDTVSGHYKCEARNKFNIDKDHKSTTLTIISKPSSVTIDSTLKESTATSVSLAWKPPEKNGNRPILQYIIRYYEMTFTNDEPKNVTQKYIRVNHTIHSIVIDQLRPYRRYGIDIVSENEVGVSDVTTVYLMTLEAPPQKPVHNLVASSTKPYEILISWSDPDLEFQNGHINKYQMCYQIIPVTEDLKIGFLFDRLSWPDISMNFIQYPNVKCQDVEIRTITVSQLPQFTDFAVRVIAFNTKGPSPPAFTKVRTLEDLPQAAPSHVTCESQNQAIALTWNPPGRQTINGILKGYVVYYYQPNKYNDESSMRSISVQGRTSVTIDQLKPYSTYAIQIMVENRKGFGPPSSSVFCSTKEARPEAPEMVKSVKINNTCMFVSWLHSLNPNGMIREYCVIGLDYNVKTRKCQSPDMNKRYNTMIFCDNYERYSGVQVFARNHYEGVVKEASIADDNSYIISFGGTINVDEGASIMLPCEVAVSSTKNIYWKKDGQEFNNNEYPNLKILKNSTLEVLSITRSDRHTYSCSTESDTIEYRLFVQDSSDGIPRIPIIDDSKVTENSVFIRWKSRGTGDIAAPITKFIISWDNLYSGESRTATVEGNVRSFYLNNVTCASDFQVRVSSQSANGRSGFSEVTRLRTLGSAPVIANTLILLPSKNISAHSLYLNLLAFEPGDNCPAMYFSIKVTVPLVSGRDFTDPIFSKNISVYDLENKCCFNVTGLRPMTTYKYSVIAYNPAGSTQTYNSIKTPPIEFGIPVISGISRTFGNQFWLLLTILIIILIAILIVVVVKALQIVRSRERKFHKSSVKTTNGNHIRIDKVNKPDDTVSIGSEPSPYAVYQPDTDPKMGQARPQQLSKQNSTPLYNYSDHHYNHISYEKIQKLRQGRPIPLENRTGTHRRSNSAECLSSVGNASVAVIADLESPDNIDPNDYFKAPYISCADNDDIMYNVQYPEFSTINNKKKRRESENLGNRREEESSRLMKNSGNQGVMNTSHHSSGSRSRQIEPPQKQQQSKPQQHQMHPISANRHIYRQQMSVPEPVSSYNAQLGYRSNRLRTSSGSGQNHPASQTVLPHSSGSSGPVSGYGSYYGSRAGNMQPHSTSINARRDVDSQNNHIFSHVSTNGLSNYNPVQRTIQSKPTLGPIESPDEGIYTDRVIVV